MSQRIIIIGAGAAGLMCALSAARAGAAVLVVEHARQAGRKILMSGGGRCNFTNMSVEPENFLSTNPHFCKSALSRYTPWDFIALVERHGIAYHEKEAGQLFCDESSKPIVQMLLRECAEAGVSVRLRCRVDQIRAEPAGFALQTDAGPLDCDRLVIATGGLSIPKMGATGFGYEVARQFGHEIRPTRAALVPLTLSGSTQAQFADLSGVSHPVRVSCDTGHFDGALLLTHRGLSGPAILQISSYWEPGASIRIDWLPGCDAPARLLQAKRDEPRGTAAGWLARVMPRRLAERLCALVGADGVLAETADKALRAFGQQLRDWPILPSGTEGYRTAEVTLGGVDTDGVSSTSFESRLQPGLYFIGEVLDVTGHLGGFNFQWAWASGHAAGQAAAQRR